MTGMGGMAMPQVFAAMPKTLVIASVAWQSMGRMDCHGPSGLAMTAVLFGLQFVDLL
jgi:hypothetical protein